MWWLPLLNLCLITFLVTVLTVKQSICSFKPEAHRNRFVMDLCNENRISNRVFARWAENELSFAASSTAVEQTTLWHRTKILTAWLIEYNAMQWAKLQSKETAETDLLEARFHLANAEVFDVAMNNGERADAEIDRADSFLGEAQARVGATVKESITSMRKDLSGLRSVNGSMGLKHGERLAIIKFELDHLIWRIHSREEWLSESLSRFLIPNRVVAMA